MIGLPGHRTQGINHIRIVQISLNIHEEPVLPVSSRNRAGFNHLHIQMAERKVIQHVIKEGMPCKFVPLEEQIESNAAFVALRERSTTKACKKVAKFLEERYGKEE